MSRCIVCREVFERPRGATTLQNWCSPECAIKLARVKQAEKARRPRRTGSTKAVMENKKNDLQWQKSQTQKTFNRMRVLQEKLWFAERGLEPECISCGRIGMDWCCGHYKTVGAAGALRFDEKNTYLQCNARCNSKMSGNIAGSPESRGYTQGLIERFGEEEGRAIIDYCEREMHRVVKWEKDDLERMRARFRKNIKELQRRLDERYSWATGR